jgi:hypothetical protein
VLSGYDAPRDRLLSNHIAYTVKSLAPFSQPIVRFPELEADTTGVSQRSKTLLMRWGGCAPRGADFQSAQSKIWPGAPDQGRNSLSDKSCGIW